MWTQKHSICSRRGRRSDCRVSIASIRRNNCMKYLKHSCSASQTSFLCRFCRSSWANREELGCHCDVALPPRMPFQYYLKLFHSICSDKCAMKAAMARPMCTGSTGCGVTRLRTSPGRSVCHGIPPSLVLHPIPLFALSQHYANKEIPLRRSYW